MLRLKTILLQDLKLLMRDKNSFFILLLMPAILVLILGSVLGSSFSVNISSFEVAFLSSDSTVQEQNFGKILCDDILKSDEMKQYVNLIEVSSEKEGKELVKDEKAVAFIHVPENFTGDCLEGKETEIQLVGDNSKSTQVGIIKQLIKGFNERLRISQISMDQIEGQAEDYQLSEQELGQIMLKLSSEEYNGTSYVNIVKEAVDSNDPISAMQYYAIAMVVMYAMFTAQTLILSMIDEKKNKTYYRIQSSPISKMEYITGKLLGIILVMVIQMIILVVITQLFYGLKWGNVGFVIMLTVAYAFSVGAITMLLGFLSDNDRVINNLSTPIIFIFSFFGGSFIPKTIMPDFAEKVQVIVPNGQALIGYLNIAQGADISVITKSVAILAGIGIAFLILSLIVIRRKGWSNGKVRKNSIISD